MRFIYHRSAHLDRRFPQVLVGPGHDCAVIAAGTEHLLLKVDQLVAGSHFREDAPIDLVARKAIARAVSDIAAAGGMPHAALAGATLPAQYHHADALFDAMARWATHFGCPLVGGDIAAGPALVLAVSIVGLPHKSRGPVLRSGARPGDGVYVTGALGGSFESHTGLGRHFTFEPRLRESAFLCDTLGPRLHAMMDLSDGLGRDAARLARASGIAILLEEALLPLAAGITDPLRALADGEDYELFFAAEGDIPASCAGTPITRIGAVEPGPARSLLRRTDGSVVDVAEFGWEHGTTP